jgi:hypothetical protein
LYLMPYEYPPWEPGYRYTQRWIHEGCIEVVLNGLHLVVRVTQGRKGGISIDPTSGPRPSGSARARCGAHGTNGLTGIPPQGARCRRPLASPISTTPRSPIRLAPPSFKSEGKCIGDKLPHNRAFDELVIGDSVPPACAGERNCIAPVTAVVRHGPARTDQAR